MFEVFSSLLQEIQRFQLSGGRASSRGPMPPRAYQSLKSWNSWDSLRTVGKGLNKIEIIWISYEQTKALLLMFSKNHMGFQPFHVFRGPATSRRSPAAPEPTKISNEFEDPLASLWNPALHPCLLFHVGLELTLANLIWGTQLHFSCPKPKTQKPIF